MNYPAIRIEGQIFSGELLQRLDQPETSGQRPVDFGLPPDVKVKDEIARAWAGSQSYYRAFRQKTANGEWKMASGGDADARPSSSPSPFATRNSPFASFTTETRNLWLIPFFSLLGYKPEFARKGEEINGKTYPISHRDDTRDGLPMHLLGWNDSLDQRRQASTTLNLEPGTMNPSPRMSPHGLTQEYLNLTEHLYALVSNGRTLRLLRDSTRLVRQSFIEFDLERMFDEDLFADFAVLFRLLHASRLPTAQSTAPTSLVEKYHQDALDQGSRIRDGLSKAVEQAILGFANGFLAHPDNDALRAEISSRHLKPETYYNHLLRLIYRFLFLLVTEERRLIFPPSVPARKRDVYYRHYSLQRIRRLAEKPHLAERQHKDLWMAIIATFRLFEADGPGQKLDVAPLAGDLFSPEAIGLLNQCALENGVVLDCLRALSLCQNPDTGQTIRVNYAALNVEEFGSVYQGLLEYDPTFVGANGELPMANGEGIRFLFKQGDERSRTGSHYTPDELVQPLIKHSLDYLIADKLEESRRMASGEWRMVEEPYRKEFIKYADQRLSGSRGMATGTGNSKSGVSVDESISQGGIVRDDLADTQGGDLDSREHRGGLGSSLLGGVHPVSPNSQRQSDGTGDASHRERGRGPVLGGIDPAHSGGNNNPGQATAGPRTKPPTEEELELLWRSTPFAIRHSLLASQALLSLRVADISCGSGHILLAAARRIATELAIARTGEEQPSPAAFRAAVRDVIRECIYGVDLNPLAVELCKVALWLEAHNPGQPLNFLDHHIKCGNAIVGYARREEVERGVPDEAFPTLPGDDKETAAELRKRNKSERKDHEQKQDRLVFSPAAEKQLAGILQHWREISGLSERTPTEITAKKKRYEEFTGTADAYLLKQILAIPIAQFYLPKTTDNRAKLITDADFRLYWTGQRHPQGQATAVAATEGFQKRFFHWFLEFPEIIERGGFDCVLGNPPYLGGQALSGTYGHAFCEWAKWEYAPAGLSDLVAYFVRRIYSLLRPDGFTAFITTNSIKDGDIRKDGLDQVLAQGGTINMAVRGIKWPGQANLVVALVAIHKGDWQGRRVLDGQDVPFISSFFEDSADEGVPQVLPHNQDRVYQGSVVLGDGFFLTKPEAQSMIEADERNREVIFSIINGSELNGKPDQAPERLVISFMDWTMERARPYTEAFAHVEDKVLPERKALANNERYQGAKTRWWLFIWPRPELYKKIRSLNRCFAAAATTKYLNFSAVSTNYVFTHALFVFTTDRWDLYAVVQSTIHEVWARKYSGALETRLRYSPSDCFETYAFPDGQWQTPNPALTAIGEHYHEHRRTLMRQLWLGLTDIYNLFHTRDLTPDKVAKVSKKPTAEAKAGYEGILELRRLHVQLDIVVRDAYGWADLDLGHAFHEVETLPENDRTRYTISPAARKELLKRLLALNHQRHAEEEAKGLHNKAATRKPGTTKAGNGAQKELTLDL